MDTLYRNNKQSNFQEIIYIHIFIHLMLLNAYSSAGLGTHVQYMSTCTV